MYIVYLYSVLNKLKTQFQHSARIRICVALTLVIEAGEGFGVSIFIILLKMSDEKASILQSLISDNRV